LLSCGKAKINPRIYLLNLKKEQSKGPLVKVDWCNKLGIEVMTLNQAMQYCNFVEEEPETAKKVA